jgi:mitochondrial splicing suppressor protein 51
MQIPPRTLLKPCPVCHLVFTCETCTSPPSHECELYQHIGNIDTFKIKHFEDSGQLSCIAPTGTPRSSFRALSTASNWLEYFTEISDKKDFVSNFVTSDFSLAGTLLQTLPDLEMQEAIRRAWLFLLIATEELSMPLTILAALEDSSIDLLTRKILSIHLIGASGKEFHNLMLFEEILHLLPSLQTLKIVLIGPNSASAAGGNTNEIELESCPPCSSRGRKRTVALYRCLYHDYIKESQYQKPDLAVLFHSGRSQAEEESWHPTTKFLVEAGILTVCTTYTHREAREEVAELERLGARFIRQLGVNKWRSLVPIPEQLEREEHAMFYHNYYRYIFQGSR